MIGDSIGSRRGNRLGVPGREQSGGADGSTALDRWLATKLAHKFGDAPLEMVLWDGSAHAAGEASEPLRVHFKDRGALRRVVWNPEMSFGDLYSSGRIAVEGDLVHLIDRVYGTLTKAQRTRKWLRALRQFLAAAPSLHHARRNIHHHYDIGNDFYRLWLDRETMQYTCAYYPDDAATLEQAQIAKMDHVCRKLRLKPGERVIETGCGWGGFAIHMAKHYGAKVRAVNISREQIAHAREWAAREGVAERVEFVLEDYRDVTGKYDVFVSIGMLEHAGRRNYAKFGRLIDRCLEPNGRGLIHSIGRDRRHPLNPWISRRIFPGSYPPTLLDMVGIFEPIGMSVVDVENLRPHYARTVRDWLRRYEESADQIREMFDEAFERAWRLYLCGSVAAFQYGTLQLFQVLSPVPGKQAFQQHLRRARFVHSSRGQVRQRRFTG